MGLPPIKGHRWPFLLIGWGLRGGEAGMFILLGDQMIGKWVGWMIFSVPWAQIYLPLKNGDRIRWKLTKNGDFDIRSFYNKLRSPLPIIFPWKGVWKVKALRHVSFFVWTAVWDRILTGNNLRGRWDFVD